MHITAINFYLYLPVNFPCNIILQLDIYISLLTPLLCLLWRVDLVVQGASILFSKSDWNKEVNVQLPMQSTAGNVSNHIKVGMWCMHKCFA